MLGYKSCILISLNANPRAKVFVPSATLGQTLVRRGIIFPLSRALPPSLLADFHSPGPPSPFLARTDNYAPRARQMRAREGGRETENLGAIQIRGFGDFGHDSKSLATWLHIFYMKEGRDSINPVKFSPKSSQPHCQIVTLNKNSRNCSLYVYFLQIQILQDFGADFWNKLNRGPSTPKSPN